MILSISCNGLPMTLSDEHSASSYGIPVIVCNDVAYGPGDQLPVAGRCPRWLRDLPESAAISVAAALLDAPLSHDARAFVRRFTSSDQPWVAAADMVDYYYHCPLCGTHLRSAEMDHRTEEGWYALVEAHKQACQAAKATPRKPK